MNKANGGLSLTDAISGHVDAVDDESSVEMSLESNYEGENSSNNEQTTKEVSETVISETGDTDVKEDPPAEEEVKKEPEPEAKKKEESKPTAGEMMQSTFTKKSQALAEKRRAVLERESAVSLKERKLEQLLTNPKALKDFLVAGGYNVPVEEKKEEFEAPFHIDKEIMPESEIAEKELANRKFQEMAQEISNLRKNTDESKAYLQTEKEKAAFNRFESFFEENREEYGIPKQSFGLVAALKIAGNLQHGDQYTDQAALADFLKFSESDIDPITAIKNNPDKYDKLKDDIISEYLKTKKEHAEETQVPSNEGTKRVSSADKERKPQSMQDAIASAKRTLFG